jgi:SAM-dependent methyltransferase
MKQTVPPSEVLVVDGRADDDTERLAVSFPGVVVHRKEKTAGLVAQYAVLASVSSEFVVFLDTDDRLTPLAIEAGLKCFDRNADAWLVCGAHRIIDAAGRPVSPVWRERLAPQQFLKLPRGGNAIVMQAAVMYRTDRLRSITGSEKGREVRKDYGADFQSACVGRIAIHDCCVAEYRCDKRLMLARSLVELQTNDLREAEIAGRVDQRSLFHHNAPQMFAMAGRELITKGWNLGSAKMMLRAARMAPLALLKTIVSRGAKSIVRRLPRSIGRNLGETLWVPGVGSVRFGDFGRIKPISVYDGSDRGKPVDRYYIERALQAYSELIRGRVLEVQRRDYTRSFGGEKVVCSDVLDIDPVNPVATIVSDLGAVGALPDGAFDCIVLTQTLQYIYNLNNAIENLYRALAPGGALLITVPGISSIGHDETEIWYWEFTELSLNTLLSGPFGESNVQVQSYGNVFAAICFLTGLALAEVGTDRLDYKDERYPVTVFACARKLRQSDF